MLQTTLIGDASTSFVTSGSEITPPDPVRLIAALRQIGYSLEQALADLVDNSINASASEILIRLICDRERIVSVALADNGSGMSEDMLQNAMRFGSNRPNEACSLGKFGMGLKLASFSHAQTLSVLTRHNNASDGRRWTLEGIEEGWRCQRLGRADVSKTMDSPWGNLNLEKSGTIVIWDRLDKLTVSSAGLRATLQTLQRRLQTHLGLCFHRFIEAGKLRIILDQQRIGTREHGIQVEITALNPFGYQHSGHREYPKVFEVVAGGRGTLSAEAHIWPPNSDSRNYSLGQNAAARQGLYFYRNGRLIQAGGWNGIVQHDTEPHSSLARVRVDLPPSLDATFGLNVQKSAVIVPPGFAELLTRTLDTEGNATFEDFRHTAQKVYRNQDRRAERELPFVPGKGVPAKTQRLVWDALYPEAEQAVPIDFIWERLHDDEMFEIDQIERVVILNQRYRAALLKAEEPGRLDAPMFKTMLLLLLEHDLSKERLTRTRKNRLSRLSRLFASMFART